MRYQLLFAILLFGTSALQADQFSFSYSGEAFPFFGSPYSVSVTGSLTATNMGGGVYDVTKISGTRDGANIVDSGIGNLGVLYLGTGGVMGLGNTGFLEFGLKGINGYDLVGYSGNTLVEGLVNLGNPTASSTATLSKFSIAAMPEPSTILIFLTFGLAVWAFGRKLRIRTLRKQ